MNPTAKTIERRIKTMTERLAFCQEHGQQDDSLEQEIAALKDQLRAMHGMAGAERRSHRPGGVDRDERIGEG